MVGVGNSEYDSYNTVAINVDDWLEKLGATRILQLELLDEAYGNGTVFFTVYTSTMDFIDFLIRYS